MLTRIVTERLRRCGLMAAALVVFGTVGYVLIEGWPLVDGFYMTIITMSTVGFGETQDLTPPGRMFTTWLIFFSIVGMSLWTAGITSLIVSGDLSGTFMERKTKKMVKKLKNHTIVCGSGMMAQSIVDTLVRSEIPVVVIDDHEENIKEIRAAYPNVPVIAKSATNELNLADANILFAKNLVAALDDEFDNLLIAMSCQDIGTQVNVFARSDDLKIANRLRKMGAADVVCPNMLSGNHIASQIVAT